jgi:hypothetical protein
MRKATYPAKTSLGTANLHEDLSRKPISQGSSDRSFGITFSVFFLVLTLTPLRRHHSVRWWALSCSVLFLAVALLRPVWLRTMNRVWTKLGLVLGQIATPLVMSLLFYLVVTPVGLIFRAMRKDPLRLKAESGAPTYWIDRRPPGPEPMTMLNQF